MGYYHPAWKQTEGDAVEFFDDAFCDFSDEPPALRCDACDEPLDFEGSLAASSSPAWPAAHRST